MTDDARAARRLLGEKQIFRDLEARATEARFARIRAGRVESVETSALHLDVLRLKRINSHVAAAAYPVLAGDNAVLFVDQHRVGEAKFHRERDGATPRVN